MIEVLFIALGAFFGAISRVAVSHLSKKFVIKGMPIATLSINISGSFALGLIIPAMTFSTPEFWFLVIGFLSSLTTFSTFITELDILWNTNRKYAIQYAICSLSLGFIALVTGLAISQDLVITV